MNNVEEIGLRVFFNRSHLMDCPASRSQDLALFPCAHEETEKQCESRKEN